MKKEKPVIVLSGGLSEESEVSKISAEEICRALMQKMFSVVKVDPADFSCYSDLVKHIIAIDPLIVFNGLHGAEGEDGRLQALLELENIPYTGSEHRACALAMDKHLSAIMAGHLGIKSPAKKIYRNDLPPDQDEVKAMGLPLVIKPNDSGSSVGICVIEDLLNWKTAFREAGKYSSHVLIEQYIPGREITVTILGENALPVVEIIPQKGWYDYANKYTKGNTIYKVPAPITKEETITVQDHALKIFNLLGCKVYSRIDFRLHASEFYFLEVNTLPGMTPLSLTPMAAREAGLEFPDLLVRIMELSLPKRP